MRFCEDHWNRLRNAINEKGMSGFVSQGGEMAARRMMEDIKGTKDPTTPFDPLLWAHWAILNKVMEVTGPYILFGDQCPLCVVMEDTKDCQCGTADHAQAYIDSCTNYLRDTFTEKGWLKPPAVQ